MPDQATSFSRRFAEYTAILREMAKKSGMQEHYDRFNGALSRLYDAIEQLNGDNAPALNGERLGELRQLYSDSLQAAQVYIGQLGQNKRGSAGSYVAQEVARLLRRDTEVMQRIPENSDIRLADAFRRARTACVDIGSAQTKNVGGKISSRMPIRYTDENGVEHKGFFTPNYRIGDYSGLTKLYSVRYPKYMGVWLTMQANPDLFERLAEITSLSRGTTKAFSGSAKDPLQEVFTDVEYPLLQADREFRKVFTDYMLECKKQRSRDNVYTRIGLVEGDSGSSVTDRNCAMSAVAAMLGMDSILAGSRRMELVQNGHAVDGCFMDAAEGYDARNLNKNDPNDLMWKWIVQTKQSGESPRISARGLRQMADLQVLDYLCGNIDRHICNSMYKFTLDNDGNAVLDGVVGIDNDDSFGKILMNENGVSHNPGLNGIGVIPESTARRILTITPETLGFVLADYGFSQAEKRAAQERLNCLQELITNARHIGKEDTVEDDFSVENEPLCVIADEKFSSLSAKQLGKTSLAKSKERKKLADNLIRTAEESVADIIFEQYKEDVPEKENEHDKAKQEFRYDPNAVVYAEGTLAQPGALTAEKAVERFSDLINAVDNLYDDAWWNTKEFKQMYSSLKEFAQIPARNTMEQTMERCGKLLENTQHYIDLKKNAPETERGRERLSFARRLRDLCSEVMEDHRIGQLASGKLPVIGEVQPPREGDNLFQNPGFGERLHTLQVDSLEHLLNLLKGDNKAEAAVELAKLVHYTKVEDYAAQHGEGAAERLLEENVLSKSVQEVTPLALEVLQSTDDARLKEIIEQPNPNKTLLGSVVETMSRQKEVREPDGETMTRSNSSPQISSSLSMSLNGN